MTREAGMTSLLVNDGRKQKIYEQITKEKNVTH